MKKIIFAILGLVGCVLFVIAGIYIYFFRGAPFSLLILDILFFGSGIVVLMISLMSKHEGRTIDTEKLSRSQAILFGICGICFSVCFVLLAITFPAHMLIKIILIVGAVLFAKWGIGLLNKGDGSLNL